MSFPCRDEGKLAAVMWNFENFNLCDEIAFDYQALLAVHLDNNLCLWKVLGNVTTKK